MPRAQAKPCIKRNQKKSFLVIVAPGGQGTKFPIGTMVSRVRGSDGLEYRISSQEIPILAPNKRITLSIKGPNALTSKRGSKSKSINPASDPGDLTITLTGQGTGIDPDVIVPVEFVDDFDPDP